uniref:B30.2/SPRY domain-containing protein n=1 Tax=Denticeps clupeoides TaxID=299321 RepID=A0AAY4BH11_9TELE
QNPSASTELFTIVSLSHTHTCNNNLNNEFVIIYTILHFFVFWLFKIISSLCIFSTKPHVCVFLSSAPVTLNPITAHPQLVLSEDLTSVRSSDERQKLPDNPERFNNTRSVLGSEGFNSGTRFWDVDVEENTGWILGVMTESAGRKGEVYRTSGIWYTCYYPKIRVTLDWDGGKLSFSDAVNNTHLHTLTHTFTERVFPYFNTGCKLSPLRILPVKIRVSVEHQN